MRDLWDELLEEAFTSYAQPVKSPYLHFANVLPDTVKFLRQIEAYDPNSAVKSGLFFAHKSSTPHTLQFLQAHTHVDIASQWDHFIRYTRLFDNNIFRIWSNQSLADEFPVITAPDWVNEQMFAGGVLNWQSHYDDVDIGDLDWYKQQPERPKEGAISEGGCSDKDHSDFELTGKSVSADEIDDLLNRITADLDENSIES